MSLITRCPTCATTFRVLPAQLSARGGRVRCGKCAAVFDGVASLLTEEAIAALPAEPSPQMGLFDPRDKAGAPRAPEERPTAEAGEPPSPILAAPEAADEAAQSPAPAHSSSRVRWRGWGFSEHRSSRSPSAASS